ncbi:MAG: DUF262 domain-containing HNH endonuclease family protein [Bacteroidota bacterium]
MADNKIQPLNEIFNNKFFRIPDYQRGYSWEKEQLDDFWEDLQNLKDGKTHYTGQITVKPINKNEVSNLEKWQDDKWLFERGMNAYYIIDGQQRITTSIIFIRQLLLRFFNPNVDGNVKEGINFDTLENWESKFLFKHYGSNYKSFIFGYEKDNPSDEFFKTRILGQQSATADRVPEQTLYTANLEYAAIYFSEKFCSYDSVSLETMFRKVVSGFKFNFYEVEGGLDEFVIFETMNNRGKSLSKLELLKTRLICLSFLVDTDQPGDELLDEEKRVMKRQGSMDRLRRDINETWKTIYEYLGKNKSNRLPDDVFLYNHWIMYFDYNRGEGEAYATFILHEKFTTKNALTGLLTFGEIKNYIESLAKSVKSWFYLRNIQFSNCSDEIKEWVQKLDRIGFGAFSPLLMAAMNKESNQVKLLELFKAAERFQFLVFRISQRKANTNNSHFFRLAHRYNWDLPFWNGGGLTDIEKVTENIQWNIHWINEDGENQGLFVPDRFVDYIAEQEGGYYSWSGLRYFLYEYELHLQQKANNNIKISWSDFQKRKKEDTIEHVFPQTPTDLYWKSMFKGVSKKHQTALQHSLGNLVLLAKEKNSSLQNFSFEYKKSHKDSAGHMQGYYNGSYSEIEVSIYDKWSPNEIIERGLKMLQFMEYRWGFNIDAWGLSYELMLNIKIDQH